MANLSIFSPIINDGARAWVVQAREYPREYRGGCVLFFRSRSSIYDSWSNNPDELQVQT